MACACFSLRQTRAPARLAASQSLNLAIWAARNVLCPSDNVVILLASPTLGGSHGSSGGGSGRQQPAEQEQVRTTAPASTPRLMALHDLLMPGR